MDKLPPLTWEHIKGHFQTITRHKLLVMHYCFRVGLYRQGLLHDLSKYTPQEFLSGARFYQGTRSPNAAEREAYGYSGAWLHHKGRNKHHFEYWIDFTKKPECKLAGVKMPVNYVAEMLMDRIAASRVYKGDAYTDSSPLEYFNREKEMIVIHPETRDLLKKLLVMLSRYGEEKTFAYVRRLLKHGSY